MSIGFPLLLIPLAVYNIIVFLMPSVSFTETLVTVPLPSGTGWPITLSDILMTLAILLLLLEVIKGARPGPKYLTDHLLSLIICAASIAEFLFWPRFASSTFFLLSLLALVDFVSGIALRTQGTMPALGTGRAGRAAAVVATRHQVEPESETGTPPQASTVTDADPFGHHAPGAFSSGSDAVPPSTQVTSPGLQPGQGPSSPPETRR
jgi:hypothetical protein